MNPFKNIITNDQFFHIPPEAIYSGMDYKRIIKQALALSKGDYYMHSFDWSIKGKSYIIRFTCNGKAYCEELQVLPDRCFDLTVIHILHEIQLSQECEGRETWYCDLLGDALGFGIGLVTVDQERELLRQGLIFRGDDEGYLQTDFPKPWED